MAFDLIDIKFPTGAWGKSFAKVGNFTLQKTPKSSKGLTMQIYCVLLRIAFAN